MSEYLALDQVQEAGPHREAQHIVKEARHVIHAWLPVHFLVPCGDAIACAEQTSGQMKQYRSFICLDTGQGGETKRDWDGRGHTAKHTDFPPGPQESHTAQRGSTPMGLRPPPQKWILLHP